VRRGDEDRRAEGRAARADDEIVQVDVDGTLQLEPGVGADRADSEPADRDASRPPEQEPTDADAAAAVADDVERRPCARAEDERGVRAGPQDDRPTRGSERSGGARESLRIADGGEAARLEIRALRRAASSRRVRGGARPAGSGDQ
jgi:hypothetical protein